MTKSAVGKYLASAAIDAIRQCISDAGGNEVFLVGDVDENKLVTGVTVFARGNKFSAPALLQVAKQGQVVLHNHPSGSLLPSEPDTHVASLMGNDGIGFYIVNNDVSDMYVVVEPFCEKKIIPVNTEALYELFSKDGPIAGTLENYEHRQQQLEMMEIVGRAINKDLVAIIEAGTGTGKTLAYLLPAIVYALNNQERMVVSTNTINLQEQLIDKDIPFLASVLGKEFKAVLVKGRSNYVCKRKLAEADLDFDLFSEDEFKNELEAVVDWAKTSRDGSRGELNFQPRPDVWEKIQSESDTSLRTKCPFYNECFFYSARRRAAKADLLVANHHLLFSDLALRAAAGASENAVLPKYDRIVFDEAHNLEAVATSYFGIRVTSGDLNRLLTRLYRKSNKGEKGLLLYLSGKFTKFARRLDQADFLAAQRKIHEFAIPAVQKMQIHLATTIDQVFSAVAAHGGDSSYRESKLRLIDAVVMSDDWVNRIVPLARLLVGELRKFTSGMSELLLKIEKLQLQIGPSVLSLTIDMRAQLDRLDQTAGQVEHVLLTTDETNVRWIEIKDGYKNSKIVRLISCPLDVSPILQKALYEPFKSILMTSATLTVDGKFDYLRNRIGLNRIETGQIVQRSLEAPFDYKSQTLLAIPLDVPEPNRREFNQVIPDVIFDALMISEGRAFVLFTSYGLMNIVYSELQGRLAAAGFNTYKQGQENRHRLLKRFREDVSSVLFGTDSFWEGVDVHGESLELVILTKLPFRVPSEPIIEARVEAIEKAGGNAFMDYTVPQAAIKFKQGFGRLIRRRTDRGAILILDKRVVQKRYGKVFLKSLPDCPAAIGPKRQVLNALREFYAGKILAE